MYKDSKEKQKKQKKKKRKGQRGDEYLNQFTLIAMVTWLV